MARVLFIYSLETSDDPGFLVKPLKSPEHIAMGISYISAVLKQKDHLTSLSVLSSAFGKSSWTMVESKLRSFSPQIVCFTSVATQYPFITKVARQIKSEHPDLRLIIGSPHVSLNPEEAIRDVYDAVCIGEGEYPMLEYVTQLEEGRLPQSIPNLWIKKNSQIERNQTRGFLSDLDCLPFLDYEMWWPFIGEYPGWKFVVLLGRGCPYNCSYCSNHALRKLAAGAYVRWRSPENIVQEIAELSERNENIKEFYLEVETINVNRKWAIELCLELKHLNKSRPDPLSFGANLRLTDRLGLDELFIALREANFRFINIGLESGSERVRREILRRNYSNDTVIKTVKLAREHGLQVAFYNLIGLPGETITDFKETVKMNRICQPDWHMTYIFYPYPGTDLYKLCLENGYIKKRKESYGERNVARLVLPGFSRWQIQKCFNKFDYYVHEGQRPRFHVLFDSIDVMVKLNSYFRLIYSWFLRTYICLDRWTGIRNLVRKLTH